MVSALLCIAHNRVRRAATWLGLAMVLFSTQVYAQSGVPLTLVVGFAAGGPTDQLARKLADELRPTLGRSILVSNQPGNLGLTATQSFQNAAPNGVQYLLVRVSSLNASDMAAYGGVHPIIANGSLQGLVPVASVGVAAQANGFTWYGIFAPPGTPAAFVTPFQTAMIMTLTSPTLRLAFEDMKITYAMGYAMHMQSWIAQSQPGQTSASAPAAQATVQPQMQPQTQFQAPTQTNTVASPMQSNKNGDDAAQTGYSDAPLSLEATGHINIAALPVSERTRYTPAQMPQGLNPTNLNVYNDLPTSMMGVRVNTILDRAQNAQTAVDQDRRGQAKRHNPSAAAHQCLKLIKEPRIYGGLTNTCNYAVEFNFCLYHPEKDSWGAMFDCEKGNGSGGSWQVGPLKNVAAHTNGAERVHWFACRWGETLGKPDGVSPADVHFDRGSRRMMGRCATWGRETERYNPAPIPVIQPASPAPVSRPTYVAPPEPIRRPVVIDVCTPGAGYDAKRCSCKTRPRDAGC